MSNRFPQSFVVSALCLLINTHAAVYAAEDKSPQSAGSLHLKIEKNRTKNFGDSPVIIVPTVQVKLAVAGKVFVAKQGSALSTLGGGSPNSVKAKAHYVVLGLDKKLAQEIARKVQDDFVARLREAGYTVKTYEDIKDIDAVKNAKREAGDKNWDMPLEKDATADNVFVVASPSDEQAFKTGLGGGVFNQFMKMGRSTMGEGTIVIPAYTISAPQAWGETGSGFKTISATVNVAPGMNLTFAMASLLTEKGAWGDVRTKEQVINISENVGTLAKQDTTPTAANALSAALSTLGGGGSISSKSGNYQMTIDPVAYEAGVLNGTSAFNAEVAKVVAEARK